MAEQHPKQAPARGSIRRRGNSFRVRAGTNPETDKPHYLTETHTDPEAAEKARARLVAAAFDTDADRCRSRDQQPYSAASRM